MQTLLQRTGRILYLPVLVSLLAVLAVVLTVAGLPLIERGGNQLLGRRVQEFGDLHQHFD